MARTYIPTLVLLARMLSRYASRWYSIIYPASTTEQKEAFAALVTALDSVLAAYVLVEGD